VTPNENGVWSVFLSATSPSTLDVAASRLAATYAISWNTSCLRATTTATLTPIACLHCSPAFVFSVVPALAAIRYLESRRTVYKHEDFATHFIVALSPLNA
jgi:hypothetical protein